MEPATFQLRGSAPGASVVWWARRQGRPDPHWAIAILQDPREELPESVPGIDCAPTTDIERALGMFDEEVSGWVPYWFPTAMHLKRGTDLEETVQINDQERLEWFDKALAYCAQTEWPPQGTIGGMKRAIALSILQVYDRVEAYELPAPGEML